jgi:hypothetical protein
MLEVRMPAGTARQDDRPGEQATLSAAGRNVLGDSAGGARAVARRTEIHDELPRGRSGQRPGREALQ